MHLKKKCLWDEDKTTQFSYFENKMAFCKTSLIEWLFDYALKHVGALYLKDLAEKTN